jgi:hypothetical protein
LVDRRAGEIEYEVVFPCGGEGCTHDSDVTVRWVRDPDAPSLHICLNCLWKGTVMPDIRAAEEEDLYPHHPDDCGCIAHQGDQQRAGEIVPDPLRLPCEGAGCPPARTTLLGTGPRSWAYIGICSMCGQNVTVDAAGNCVEHDRQDLLAMIERGDFG